VGRKFGRRPDGSRIKNRAAARNARPKVKYLITGGSPQRSLLTDPLDRRSQVYKIITERIKELREHIGTDITYPLSRVLEQAARLSILVDTAWAAVNRDGVLHRGEATSAAEAFRKLAAEERQVLAVLGLERRERQVPRLKDVLQGEDE